MNKIIKTKFLNERVKLFEIESPLIAQKRKPGQFIMLRISEEGERIPMTIADSNVETGTITIIVQSVGKTTSELQKLEAGDTILDIVGPLGKPTHIEKFGNCVIVGGGVGAAIAYPTAKAIKEIGNYVTIILGAKSKEYIILKDEVSTFADEVYITTEDGSEGMKGLVTEKLKQVIEEQKIDFVLAIGPVPMMEAVASLTKPYGIKTVVSLNSIMLDGTGMCGGCRAVVGGKNVFVCVDGPEFDAHEVDFTILMQRNNIYRDKELECNLEKQANEMQKKMEQNNV